MRPFSKLTGMCTTDQGGETPLENDDQFRHFLTLLHMVLVVESDANAVSRVFNALGRHYCRVVSVQFNIEPDAGTGKMHLRVRSDFDPEKLLVALLRDPIVREATILKDLRPTLL